MSCTVELLSIGNELLLGNTVNTNASWIASRVTELGGQVVRVTTVPDDLGEISKSIIESSRRKPNFLITTGGIGPTFDDMTFRASAKALRSRVRVDTRAVEMMRQHYARRFPNRRLILTKPRLKMATIPARSEPIRNPVGTAPAIEFKVGKTLTFCLPGVPKETMAIFNETVAPIIEAKSAGATFLERWLQVRGVTESRLAPLIDRTMSRWPSVYIKSHPRGIIRGRSFIELHFSTHSRNPKSAERDMDNAVAGLKTKLMRIEASVRTKV